MEKFVKIDDEFYRSDTGYIRKVLHPITNRYVYVGWRHYQPVLGYFNDLSKIVNILQKGG